MHMGRQDSNRCEKRRKTQVRVCGDVLNVVQVACAYGTVGQAWVLCGNRCVCRQRGVANDLCVGKSRAVCVNLRNGQEGRMQIVKCEMNDARYHR